VLLCFSFCNSTSSPLVLIFAWIYTHKN
jgi:hypothetical protein